MITSIAIQNFKGIRELNRLPLGPFTFSSAPTLAARLRSSKAIDFVKACLQNGPQAAVEQRAPEFRDLTFQRRGGLVAIDLGLDLSESSPSLKRLFSPGATLTSLERKAELAIRSRLGKPLHYKLAIQEDDHLGVRVAHELLERPEAATSKAKRLLGKTSSGSDFYQREKGTYTDSFVFGLDKLALEHTPPDESRYPTANAVRRFLMEGVRYHQLNSRAMREPCSATRPTELELDGTNLARVVGRLIKQPRMIIEDDTGDTTEARPLQHWTHHLRYALDDLKEISWATRAPDNAEYIVLRYEDGLECPSWLLSDGTLRMLALTLLPFLPPAPSIYMVEEPENGVHPKALEIILKALAAGIPGAQMFVATHSPLVVQEQGVETRLCFTRDQNGVQIVPGERHPGLRDWQGIPDLATVFASRVLG